MLHLTKLARAAAALTVASLGAPAASQALAVEASALEKPTEFPPPGRAATMANWVLATHDNNGLPFIIIDKVGAEVFIFDASGTLIGKTAALIGSAKGDDSAPGIGHEDYSGIAPELRTTPAGRFVGRFGVGRGHPEVFWVDYADSISLHPVVTSNKKEHRLQRLQSPTRDDNRITYGCINVPASFYRNVVRPLFLKTGGITYILPETRPLSEVFPAAQFARQAE
jgi:hypothetical protein